MTEGNGTAPTTLRFDQKLPIEIGRTDVVLEPLRGLDAIKEFEVALADEVRQLRERIESKLLDATTVSPEALLERGADQARLLKLGAPGVITDGVLAQSTANERLTVLTLICQLNNLGRYVPFFAPEVLMDLGSRMAMSRKASPGEPPQPSSSAPAPAGETSAAS